MVDFDVDGCGKDWSRVDSNRASNVSWKGSFVGVEMRQRKLIFKDGNESYAARTMARCRCGMVP